jgi:cysteinyl-tRNA synthetase
MVGYKITLILTPIINHSNSNCSFYKFNKRWFVIKIYNTLKRQKEEFIPLNENKVNMYVCGVTVYDYCHIGHARSSVVFDVIRRYLTYKGFDVKFVKNFTDIDDKIIKRSNEENIDWRELTAKFINEHDNDMQALNILPPTETPKATEYITEMIKLTKKLIDKGYAYESDGDVYFKVESFKDYGKLSNRDIEDLKAGARIEINESKKNPLDFALWKKSKENEPFWESPWGKGRPGWHIECSAMSSKIFGLPFDIHGGGKDLIFPHHENEIAQSEAAEEKEFVKYWMHNGFVNINKEKMSKSLNNFFTIRDVLNEISPEVLRFFLLTTHYRSPLDFSFEKLIESEASVDRVYTMLDELNHAVPSKKGRKFDENLEKIDEKFRNDFESVMDDDFNTASALSVVFEYVREVNTMLAGKLQKNALEILKEKNKNVFEVIKSTLGIFYNSPEEWFKANLTISEEELNELIKERNTARKNKNFEKADEIRNFLKEKGIELLDTPTGTRFHAKKVRVEN